MSHCAAVTRLVFSVTALMTAATALAELSELDEIVVTARMIEERVQDIPMSVQVVSGEYLDDADLNHLFSLQFNMPGLVVNNVGGYGAGFALRGISDQASAGGLSVATHLNGVFLGDSGLAIARLFDLQRIEVLKGPQGTLYGRNSTGGSINFITRAPEDEFGAEIETAYGSFDTARMQGFLNLPSETADLRLAFIASEGAGRIRNTVDHRKFAEDDFLGLRASLRFAFDSGLRVNLMAQHVTEDGASGELWLPNPEYLPDASDLQLTTVTLADPFLETKNSVVSAEIEFDLEFATLRSISGYAHSDVNDKDDCAGLPMLQGCVRRIGPDIYTQWSQELQLVSPGDTRVGWLAGLYYLGADNSTYYYVFAPLNGPVPQNDKYSTADERVFAVYAQATANFAESWSVTAGLRYTWEDSQLSSIDFGGPDSPTEAFVEDEWGQLSWRTDLSYTASEDMLMYVGISTGFKSGGVTSTRLPTGEFDDYDAEYLTAYEMGIKSQWLEQRLTLNAAAFFYDFEDLQVRTVVVEDGIVPYPETDNAADAEIYGIDTAATLNVSDRFMLSGGLIWLPKREFVDYVNDLTGDTLSGNKLARVPEWNATAAIDYTFPFSSRGNLVARIEYNYRSGFFYTQENTAIFSQDGFGLLNLFLRFEPENEKWYAFASGRNLTDEDYFTQVFIQSSPGYPDTYEVGFGLRF